MTPKQYRAALVKLGLTQQQAATMLGVGERTSRNWALGQARIPESVSLLLRLMIKKKIKPEDLTS